MRAIATSQLTKKYGNIVAVDNLNLTVEHGELFALLGVNGAGKTTTIKMLSCLIKPTSGDALLLGNSIISDPRAIKKKINISPQETAVAANLSVLENLELIAGIYGQDSKTAKKNAYEIAQKFKLENELNKKAKLLSGGMQRRLSIAMALISDPQILFLDEPTLGLDVLARRELWASIKALKGKVTIILTTHYMDEVETLSDRVGIMSKGKLTAMGTVAELTMQTDTAKLEDAFVALSGGVL
ncbi:ABC transporter ATP-binding protein [Treponema putidum]|uniref:ABC transporter ATP-binding protein n=1 Tax=Treponema putidum TaxID=221027 RepID=A0AAE9SHQ3_9SPIR|nr:ABC transporter ATP-binding protein [Treponema putidum]AIN93013.1 ABC transporter ATP-binding protein [Treponema putidum]TWI78486.1 ABC-2 type transport system ATP-binding protein [Treponema putidum]UTY29256.1 ABC transporter ATP-binding protein [Treponema putidum]UTY31753.1 ABC transporter ATP-binding protein [Treponema putidum]UTY34113.1 ABC transporter ATP-binding protein [Treponema putidum]